jgi:hypothetical protein
MWLSLVTSNRLGKELTMILEGGVIDGVLESKRLILRLRERDKAAKKLSWAQNHHMEADHDLPDEGLERRHATTGPAACSQGGQI